MVSPLIEFTPQGIYCPQADVHIDPWRSVKKAIITHAHADHARWGHHHYLAHTNSRAILKHRLGEQIRLQTAEYGQSISINGVEISLHPSGHIYGAAQIRLAYKGEVWVISGDYKAEDDGISTPFEVVPCQHFVSESTFGLPVFDWQHPALVFEEINQWWSANRAAGMASVIGCYALGKAQRLLKGLSQSIGPIYVHGALHATNEALSQDGLLLPPNQVITKNLTKDELKGAMVLCPPSAMGTSWMNKFKPYSTALASGWMGLRGTRRRRAVDRGFILSDHADWKGLNAIISATGAEHVYVTHGYTAIFSKWLQEKGINAQELQTGYSGEDLHKDEA
jgi:putative mRNA 3-end processing factor